MQEAAPAPIQLRAEIQLNRNESWQCELTDVSPTHVVARGLTADAAALPDGAFVNLRVALPERGEPQPIPAQVSAVDAAGLRLVFAIPEHDSVRSLTEWVRRQRAGSAPGKALDAHRAREIYQGCCSLAQQFFSERVERLTAMAKDNLFERSANANSNTDQAEAFDAMQEAERIMPSVTKAFLEGVECSFEALWNPDSAEKPTTMDTPDELALIDTGSFNDWLLTVQIIDRVRRVLDQAHTSALSRLQMLLSRDVEANDVPFGLEDPCARFHDALQNLGATRRTRQALLIAFEMAIGRELPVLHAEIAALLEQAGVAETEESSVPPAACLSDRQNSPADATPNAFGTTKALLELRRQAPTVTAVDAHQRSAEAEQVAQTLSQLAEQGWPDWDSTRPLELAKRASQYLESHHLATDPDSTDIMEMVSDLVDAMLQDALVHADVKTRIGRLALPLARTALAGDPFFADESHPARQLLDQMGHLRPGADSFAAGALRTVDAAIETIVGASVPSSDDYQSMLINVSPLAQQQRDAVAERVASLTQKCQAQQSAVELLKRKDDSETGRPESRTTDAPEAWKEWLARSAQLEPGDIVLFNRDHKGSRPATLAWKTADDKIFAFVDHDSGPAVTLSQQELAMDMRRGQVGTVDGGALPLTERALCRQLHDLHREVTERATNDELTGLVNRKHFEDRVGAALQSASECFESDHLCLVQIDNFEQIRYACGQKSTNQLLKRLAEMLERLIGTTGVVCRLKGARFAILITEEDEDGTLRLLNRYRRAVEEARCVFKGKPIPMSVSLGLAALSTELESPTQALKAVREVLEEAVSAGGNQLRHFDPPAALSAHAGEPSVAELIKADRMALRAQRVEPISPDDSGLEPYYEILLGVRDEEGVIRPPGRTIAAAEARGEIMELDRWVIRAAFGWMSEDRSRLARVCGYAINLSGISLSDERLRPFVLEQLEELPVPPEKVIFEVTETAAIDKLSVAQDFIHSLKALGCRFSLDDFGVGHGSFAYLRNLPVDKIKIDGMFVKDLCDNPNDRAVVKSINEIAHFMERRTVAEFVEDDDILAVLRGLEVDYAQGYGVEKPMPISELLQPGAPLAVAAGLADVG